MNLSDCLIWINLKTINIVSDVRLYLSNFTIITPFWSNNNCALIIRYNNFDTKYEN